MKAKMKSMKKHMAMYDNKMTEKQKKVDEKMDKKKWVKEGSKADIKMDKMIMKGKVKISKGPKKMKSK